MPHAAGVLKSYIVRLQPAGNGGTRLVLPAATIGSAASNNTTGAASPRAPCFRGLYSPAGSLIHQNADTSPQHKVPQTERLQLVEPVPTTPTVQESPSATPQAGPRVAPGPSPRHHRKPRCLPSPAARSGRECLAATLRWKPPSPATLLVAASGIQNSRFGDDSTNYSRVSQRIVWKRFCLCFNRPENGRCDGFGKSGEFDLGRQRLRIKFRHISK